MTDIRFAKLVLLVNGLVPGMLLLWDVYHGRAGANPVNYAILTLGLCALIFLSLALLVTPLRKITGLQWLFHLRRRLGLLAFGYALAHFSTFFIFDRMLSIRSTLSEMVKRPYLIVGSVGLLAMVPLAATSTNAMIKRLGPQRWQALHRLAYVAAVAGIVHFYMQVKSDTRLPIAFGGAVAILLGYRGALVLAGRWKHAGGQPIPAPVEVSPEAGRWSGLFEVERITRETTEVRTFRLRPADGGALPFTYLPGQYLTIALPIGGETVRRSYTIASTPTRSGYCEITTKREAHGLASRYMHEALKVGDRVAIIAPAGRFTFTGAEATGVALLAGGVGITPLMSILRYLTDQGWGGQIYFVYSAKIEQDLIFRQELEALQRRFPNLHLTLTLTRGAAETWRGATGRIDAALLTRVIPDVTGIPFYLCGPAEMLVATRAALRHLGVLEPNIRTESFGAPWRALTPGAATGGPEFTVTFTRSNKAARIHGGRPILAVADELGVQVDSECRSGICGRCKTRMVSGSVMMETQDALDSADRRNNVILLCQARALEDVAVEA
jgi:glycine betaine catabolism B